MPIDVRALEPAAWPDVAEVLGQSFNLRPGLWDTFRERLGDENVYVAREGGRVVGGCGVYRIGQVWGGRAVPLGGVAGVGVAPDARGRGVARAMMEAVLRALRADGCPVAGLYPASLRVYRSVGYEQSGERVRYEVPLAALSGFRFEVEVRPVEPLDVGNWPAFAERYRPVHGNLVRNDALWARLAQPHVGRRFAWLLGEDGYVILHHHPAEAPPFDLEIVDVVAPSAATARTLFALLAGHRSMAKKVRWWGPPGDALLTWVPEPVWAIVEHQRWMIRLTDVAAALRGRGWTGGEGELHLHVEDELLPENAGNLVLTVAGGQAEVRPGGRGELRVSTRGEGPLYAGFFPASALVGLGLVAGPEAAVATADRLFAGPIPWMREMY
jgi:predicted acetyltransferase